MSIVWPSFGKEFGYWSMEVKTRSKGVSTFSWPSIMRSITKNLGLGEKQHLNWLWSHAWHHKTKVWRWSQSSVTHLAIDEFYAKTLETDREVRKLTVDWWFLRSEFGKWLVNGLVAETNRLIFRDHLINYRLIVW